MGLEILLTTMAGVHNLCSCVHYGLFLVSWSLHLGLEGQYMLQRCLGYLEKMRYRLQTKNGPPAICLCLLKPVRKGMASSGPQAR